MTKRYYYKDPLKAAIFMCDWGGRILDKGFGDTFEEITLEDLYEMLVIDSSYCKFHIHPDSMGIFEPQEGDLVVDNSDEGLLKLLIKKKNDGFKCKTLGYYGEVIYDINEYKIIQRDGKYFPFWEGVEDA